MKKLTSIIAIAFLMTLGFNAVAQINGANTKTVTAEASATIVEPINITTTGTLDFGKIAAHASNEGTVVLTPDNDISNTGGTSLIGTTHSVGTFSVTGDANATFSITYGNGTLNSTGSSEPMIVDTFTNSLETTTSTLDADGEAEFTVGATLHVNADQADGSYTGNYTVTVQYN